MMQRTFTLLTIAAFLSGCATPPESTQKRAPDANRAEGEAVVTLTLAGKPLDQISRFEYSIRQIPPPGGNNIQREQRFASVNQFTRWATRSHTRRDPVSRRAANEVSVGAPVWTAVVKGDGAETADIVENGQPIGRQVTLRLPAGEYEFFRWKLVEQNAYGTEETRSARTFSHRFDVQPGKTSALERLHLQIDSETHYTLTVADRRNESGF